MADWFRKDQSTTKKIELDPLAVSAEPRTKFILMFTYRVQGAKIGI